MRAVSFAILIIAGASLAGCCCGSTASYACTAEQPFGPSTGEPQKAQVLLETTCLMYRGPSELDAIAMATTTRSEPLDEAASTALLEALHKRAGATILAAPSVVTRGEEDAVVAMAETLSEPFVGQHIAMSPHVREADDAVELDFRASWHARGKQGKPGTRRRIQDSMVVPNGKGVIVFAPEEAGNPGYAVLVRVTRLDPQDE